MTIIKQNSYLTYKSNEKSYIRRHSKLKNLKTKNTYIVERYTPNLEPRQGKVKIGINNIKQNYKHIITL